MRAKEFISEKQQQVDEILPIAAALGGALARGAASAGGALARGAIGAVGNAAKQTATNLAATGAQKLAGTKLGQAAIGSTTGTTGTQQPGQQSTEPVKPTPPVSIPVGTKLEPIPTKDPNKLSFNIGGGTFSLDIKDPKNAQLLQQLGQVKPK